MYIFARKIIRHSDFARLWRHADKAQKLRHLAAGSAGVNNGGAQIISRRFKLIIF